MHSTRFVRAAASTASVALLAGAIVAIPLVTGLAPAEPAVADAASCTGYRDFPNVRPGSVYAPTFFYGEDTEVGTYIAGDWTVVPGAAEGEGLIVVGGDASFSTGEGFYLGTVGVGSQVSAPAGSDMLTVGGDVTVSGPGSLLDVGPNRGGNMVVGGTISPALPSASYSFNGGTGTAGVAGALTPYAGIPTSYLALSTELEGLSTAGSTVDLSAPTEVHFIGDGVQSRQVFTIDGGDLGTTGAVKDIHFDNMATDAVVVINVTGTTAELNNWRFYVNGDDLDHESATDRIFSNWAQSIIWNFVDATDVTLGVNTQIPGAIIIPTPGANLDLYASINGRLFVNGDVTMGGGGSGGIELHNYPMRSCSLAASTGSFTIGKTVVNSFAPGVAVTTTAYTGTYDCVVGGSSVASGSFSITASTTQTVTGLPIGATCSVTETAPAGPVSGDASYVWAAPSYAPATITVSTGTPPTITITNTVARDVGALAIEKLAITGVTGVADPARAYSGTWSCTNSAISYSGNGTWSVTAAGAQQVVANIPDGSSCTIAETSLGTGPSATDPSYRWNTPVYSPGATVSIATGATSTVSVQNSVRRALGDLEMIKVLDDPYDVVDLGRVYTGTWSCTGPTPVSGTWSTTAGAPPVSLATGLPAGTVCTIAEDASTLDAPPLVGYPQFHWASPTIAPATITIAEGVTGRFVVTNIVVDPFDVLAHAGADVALPLGIGAGGLLLGLVLVLRRRVASRRATA